MTMTLSGTNGGIGVIGSSTAVASTSGTSIDFTSLPAGLKRITVMFNGVSTNGTSIVQIQIGSGSVTTSGYNASASVGASNAIFYNNATSGFILEPSGSTGASILRSGMYQLTLIGSNTWVGIGNTSSGASVLVSSCGGNSPALGGALDRVRITTVNGTDTFDAGSINILYE